MKRFRLVVVDGSSTYRYPCPTYEDAYQGWVTLHDHARDEVTFTMQRRLHGRWVDVADPKPPTGGEQP